MRAAFVAARELEDTAQMREDQTVTVTDPEQVDAVMLAMRVLVAVTAQSVAELDERVTLPQLRVLVVIASRGPQNLAAVAQGLGVHSS
jgi:hypothetical protein